MASIGGKKLTQLRVTDLKTELEKRGLDKSGLKNALVERLEKSLLDESGWSDFMEQGDNLMSTAEGTQTQNGDVDELNTPLDDNIEQPSRSNEPIIDAESLNCKPQPDGEQRQSKTSVVVAGDSIIKYVKGWELSNDEQIVSVKSFSGATVDDMGDFLKPSIRKRPDKLIIHAGTNDVRSSSPTTIAKKVTELAEQFKKESSNTRIIISSLVTGSDNQDLARKVNDTNNIIKSNCCKKNWVFLDNSNINRSHLNYRGLHLNHEGIVPCYKIILKIF